MRVLSRAKELLHSLFGGEVSAGEYAGLNDRCAGVGLVDSQPRGAEFGQQQDRGFLGSGVHQLHVPAWPRHRQQSEPGGLHSLNLLREAHGCRPRSFQAATTTSIWRHSAQPSLLHRMPLCGPLRQTATTQAWVMVSR